MSEKKSTKQALVTSAISLILCISMLLGTTFAWFTDSITSAGNIIKAGNLKIDMKWSETYNGENTVWNDAEGSDSKPVFDYDNWEPGYTVVRYIKVSNEGNLAFKYLMNIIPTGVVGKLAEVIDVQYDIVTNNNSFRAPTVNNKNGSLSTVGTLNHVIDSSKTVVSGVLLPKNEEKAGFYSGEIVVCVSLHMQEDSGNKYQGESIGDSFKIQLLATQYEYEKDSFGNLYDLLADYSIYVTQSKTLVPGADAVEFSIENKNIVIARLTVPASAIKDTSKPVKVTVDGIDPTETIVIGESTKSFAYDIDVTNLKENLSGDQLVTVVLTAPNALSAVQTYHKGALIDGAAYDEVEGTITFKTASFSPYAVSYKEYEVSTIDELRDHAAEDDANIKLMADLEVNLDPGAAGNNCDPNHFSKLTGSYEYYNGVNINGKNVAVDLNGHDIVVSGDKDGDTVGAVFFIMPNSNLNITDSEGNGMIKVADPAYVVWAPYDVEYGLSYVDVYSGIFAAHRYAGDTRTPGYFAMFYAGEGGKIDIRGGYYLYENESYTDKNGTVHENVNNGAFNVMNSATTECITIHDSVMLNNQYYRQDGYNSNNKNADHDSIFLAEHCDLVKVSQSKTIGGDTYDTWYQVQTTKPTRFETKFEHTDSYTYRVGNMNEVSLGSLFRTDNAVSAGANIDVQVTGLNNSVSGTYTPVNSPVDWAKGTIKFEGTGLAKISINGCELTLEVIDAMNATSAVSATKNNVVLLKDCGFSSLEVSGGYTLYGNGFTMTCSSDSAALDMGYAFVTLNNGTLDNIQIVTPNFDYAVLYKSNMTESGNRSETTDRTRYFNVKSGVMVYGNSQILNSRISGARAAVNVSGGNVVIDNSRLELGAVATLLVGAANKLTLRDVTLVQKPTASTHDSSKTLMGFSTLFICDAEGNAAPVTLEGTLVQHAWVTEADKKYVPGAGQSIISNVLSKTEYLHDIDGDGTKESLNLGFAYMPESLTSKVKATTITDNRTDKNTVPYDYAEISILNGKTYVYSYKNTNGTDDSFKNKDIYTPNTQSDNITVSYSDTAEGLTARKSYGTDGWVHELNVDLDKVSGYTLDFSKLSMSVNGVLVNDFKVNGSAKPTSPVVVTAGGITYTLTAIIDGKEYTATYKVTGTETSKESPSLVASNYEAGLCVASSYGGTWHGAAPALEGIQIKYWSVAENQYKTIKLSDYTPTKVGQQNGVNTTWTYSPDNGDFTLTLTGGQVHSGNSVNAMPVVCEGKLYFVASSSNGLVKTGNSARTIPVSYVFKDNNNGTPLTFSHTWSVAENKDEQYKYSDFCNGTLTQLSGGGSSGGCVTPDTLITLADGSQKAVSKLTGEEMLLVWNMETGSLDSAPIMFVDNDPESTYEVIKLYFSDDTEVNVISEHGFWDYDLNKYVYLGRNAAQYIGHTFAKQNGDVLEQVELVDVVLENQVTTSWSPVTAGHLCYFVNDMLSMPGGVGGLFNIFDVDAETMTYDYEAMARDIETYGMFTYEELSQYAELSRDMFDAAGGQYLKVSIGKGNLTEEELIAMIERYSKYFE